MEENEGKKMKMMKEAYQEKTEKQLGRNKVERNLKMGLEEPNQERDQVMGNYLEQNERGRLLHGK